MKCIAMADCEEEGQPKKGGICEGHAKQASRGEPYTLLRLYDRRADEVLIDAAIDLGNADSEDDGAYKQQRRYVLLCALRYAFLSRGLCIECGRRPHRPGEQRCEKCGRANARRCALWKKRKASGEKAKVAETTVEAERCD